MTTTAAAGPDEQRRLLAWGVAAVLVSTILNAAGVFSEDEIHWLNLLLGFMFALVGALIVFGWFARRAERRPSSAWVTGLACAVLGLLLVVAFWSGLPPVLGLAGAYLGYVSYSSGLPRWPRWAGVAAMITGGLAVAADIAVYIGDVASRL